MYTMPSTNCKITILTGEVHCGKSRALGRFLTEVKDLGKTVKGLLNPSIDHEKWFVNLDTDDIFSAEKLSKPDRVIKVGNYEFSANAFDRAKDIISQDVVGICDYFVIDELGKLELNGTGFEPEISQFLKKLPDTQIRNVIIVVRDFLVDDAIAQFQLESPAVIKQTDLFLAQWN